MATILIVEDEQAIADLISLHLDMAGHRCHHVAQGIDVMDGVAKAQPDLILLDIMLPDTDGFTLMEKLAPLGIPVVFLTALGQLPDKVKAFGMGAHDYIVKPFEAAELIARINAIIKRTAAAKPRSLRLDNLEIRLDEHTVLLDGKEVDLAAKEFALLETLLQHKNMVLSREQLLEQVWGYDFFGDSRTVDVHIRKLRQKLSLERRIKTIHRVGYKLEV